MSKRVLMRKASSCAYLQPELVQLPGFVQQLSPQLCLQQLHLLLQRLPVAQQALQLRLRPDKFLLQAADIHRNRRS